MSKRAFVQTLDGAWEKLRQVGPARIGLEPVLAHSSSEVRASIYWMPTAYGVSLPCLSLDCLGLREGGTPEDLLRVLGSWGGGSSEHRERGDMG